MTVQAFKGYMHDASVPHPLLNKAASARIIRGVANLAEFGSSNHWKDICTEFSSFFKRTDSGSNAYQETVDIHMPKYRRNHDALNLCNILLKTQGIRYFKHLNSTQCNRKLPCLNASPEIPI